jgi:hypothetical protein
MLFAITDERGLEIFDDANAANVEIEGYDVESGAVVFYDERGCRLVPRFPHRSTTRIFGLRVSNDPGPYEFELSPDSRPALLEELGTVRFLSENRWFKSIDEVRQALEAGDAA